MYTRRVVLGGAGDVVASQLTPGRAGVEQLLHVDASAAMLDAARRAGQHLEPAVRREFLLGSDDSPPVEDESVDAVVACLGRACPSSATRGGSTCSAAVSRAAACCVLLRAEVGCGARCAQSTG